MVPGMTALQSPDYQQFAFGPDGEFASVGARMALKLRAMPKIDFIGKRVLDVGCDHGFWCWRAAQLGAASVLGLDRGRPVRATGFVDLPTYNEELAAGFGVYRDRCRFGRVNLGRQWLEFGEHDVVLMMSMYHHVYEAAGGDHAPIWFWLRRHVAMGGVVVWENPFVTVDSTVAKHVSPSYFPRYTKAEILRASAEYFEAECVGPALHSPTREVYLFHPKPMERWALLGRTRDGVKGASKAMVHNSDARAREVEEILGYRPFAGSLNFTYPAERGAILNVRRGYYRATIQEMPRGNIDGVWYPRWTRFYPISVAGHRAHAVAFEDQKRVAGLTECYAPERLRDFVSNEEDFELLW
jgi:hypothetical protein